jgi:hypothetical protein
MPRFFDNNASHLTWSRLTGVFLVFTGPIILFALLETLDLKDYGVTNFFRVFGFILYLLATFATLGKVGTENDEGTRTLLAAFLLVLVLLTAFLGTLAFHPESPESEDFLYSYQSMATSQATSGKGEEKYQMDKKTAVLLPFLIFLGLLGCGVCCVCAKVVNENRGGDQVGKAAACCGSCAFLTVWFLFFMWLNMKLTTSCCMTWLNVFAPTFAIDAFVMLPLAVAYPIAFGKRNNTMQDAAVCTGIGISIVVWAALIWIRIYLIAEEAGGVSHEWVIVSGGRNVSLTTESTARADGTPTISDSVECYTWIIGSPDADNERIVGTSSSPEECLKLIPREANGASWKLNPDGDGQCKAVDNWRGVNYGYSFSKDDALNNLDYKTITCKLKNREEGINTNGGHRNFGVLVSTARHFHRTLKNIPQTLVGTRPRKMSTASVKGVVNPFVLKKSFDQSTHWGLALEVSDGFYRGCRSLASITISSSSSSSSDRRRRRSSTRRRRRRRSTTTTSPNTYGNQIKVVVQDTSEVSINAICAAKCISHPSYGISLSSSGSSSSGSQTFDCTCISRELSTFSTGSWVPASACLYTSTNSNTIITGQTSSYTNRFGVGFQKVYESWMASCGDTGISCFGEDDGSTSQCSNSVANSVCVRGQCMYPQQCYRQLASGCTDIGHSCTEANGDSCVSFPGAVCVDGRCLYHRSDPKTCYRSNPITADTSSTQQCLKKPSLIRFGGTRQAMAVFNSYPFVCCQAYNTSSASSISKKFQNVWSIGMCHELCSTVSDGNFDFGLSGTECLCFEQMLDKLNPNDVQNPEKCKSGAKDVASLNVKKRNDGQCCQDECRACEGNCRSNSECKGSLQCSGRPTSGGVTDLNVGVNLGACVRCSDGVDCRQDCGRIGVITRIESIGTSDSVGSANKKIFVGWVEGTQVNNSTTCKYAGCSAIGSQGCRANSPGGYW